MVAGLVVCWYPQFTSVTCAQAIACLHEAQFGRLTEERRNELVGEAYDLCIVQERWTDVPLYLGILIVVLSGTLLNFTGKSRTAG